MINDGYLGTGRTNEDYVAGSSPVVYEVRNEMGDWRQYVPVGEKQFNYKADSMSCVSFSAINCIEAQEFQQTGIHTNYSDRWIAKMSNTTPDGNYLKTVIDTIREYGLVLEEDYPTPKEPWTWEDYHAPIPEPLLSELKAKGKEWLKTHEVSYEWVDLFFNPQELQKQLQHAPLQMVFPNHAVAGVKQDIIYFDTYEPFLKERPKSQFSSALKILLTVKGNQMVGYKKVGDPTTYVEVSGRLVPLADWVAFTAMGGSSDSVVELNDEQFNKFVKINSVLFKSK
jgi:hypothetical protein